MKIKIILGDITQVRADLIVNAANCELKRGAGVCGAIYAEAGYELDGYLSSYSLDVGDCLITPAFGMQNAQHIAHTVGPQIFEEGVTPLKRELLYWAYRSVFMEAKLKGGITSISFPAISTGVYAFPMNEALVIVRKALTHTHFKGTVNLVCYSMEDYEAYKKAIKPWDIWLDRLFR